MHSVFRLSGLLLLLAGFPLSSSFAREKWIEVVAPHFTILTDSNERVAREWAFELELFRRTLGRMLQVPEERIRPATVVLFRSERSMRPFKPLEDGKPKRVAGFFVPVGDSHAFALALDEDPKLIRQVLFHEAVHWHNEAIDHPLPTWMEEGLAEVYSTFEAKPDGEAFFGRPIQRHLQIMGGKPFDVVSLSQTTREAIKFNSGHQAELLYARSWAAVHYLVFGKDTPGPDSLRLYLEASKTQPPEQAFRTAFGIDGVEFSQRLGGYIKRGEYTRQTFRISMEDFKNSMRVRPAHPAEVERALAVLLIGSRGRPTSEALARLQHAAELDPTSARIWQARGEAALYEKKHSDAAVFFRRAIEAGTDSYYVHYGLGACRLQDQDMIAGFFSPAEAALAAANFRAAIKMNPRFVPAYEGLAGVISVLDQIDPLDRERLLHAEQLAPQSAIIRIGLAVIDLLEGREELGRAALQTVRDAATTPAPERKFADDLLTEEAWKAFYARFEQTFERRDYDAALEMIEVASATFSTIRYREVLSIHRKAVMVARKLQQAVNMINVGQKEPARVLLEEILQSDAGSFEKGEARRLLQVISRQ